MTNEEKFKTLENTLRRLAEGFNEESKWDIVTYVRETERMKVYNIDITPANSEWLYYVDIITSAAATFDYLVIAKAIDGKPCMNVYYILWKRIE